MIETAQIGIEGMTCGACAGTVQYALANAAGVVHVNVAVGMASVLYDASVTDDAILRGVIEAAGYRPRH